MMIKVETFTMKAMHLAGAHVVSEHYANRKSKTSSCTFGSDKNLNFK